MVENVWSSLLIVYQEWESAEMFLFELKRNQNSKNKCDNSKVLLEYFRFRTLLEVHWTLITE